MLPGPRQVGFSGRGFWGRVPSWSAACGTAGSRGCSAGLPAQGLYPAPMASTSPLGRLSVCQPLPVRPAGWQGLGLLESVVGGNAVLDGVLTGPALPSSSEGPGPGWHSFPLMPFAVPLNVCGQGPPQARSPVDGLQAAFLRTPPPVESAPLGGVRVPASGMGPGAMAAWLALGQRQACPLLCSSSAESLDRLLPPVGSRRSPRKRTTSQCKSEPPLLRTSKRTIYTAGRPPWYNEHGTQSKEAFAIGLGGGSASGKTTVARMIIEALDVPWVVLLSMDSFYKVLTTQQQEQAARNNFNFDHPDAFDFDLIVSTLKKLKQGKSVQVPVYDFTTHSRKKDWKTLYGANVIIFEGIMAFADKALLELLDMKIFVDTDSDIRLVRRLRRDISERGRDIEGVIKQYNKFVKPAFDQYIQPTMRVADIVVPWGSGNTVAIDLIVQHMHSQLEERELSVRGSCAGICEDRVRCLSCCAVCAGGGGAAPARPAPPLRPAPPRPAPGVLPRGWPWRGWTCPRLP
ncbi:uridine-cytidine kinase-like 1 isoform X7 [Meles meles]|uniref:uridine-cytidine kinase-like 1 isoform X7 n=1 Tax=Meles meles TaxID=9662 RepID=UPI001E69C22D|nr:uridine-cytidine kinase-like 1 isoform X7 [Meles meles]